VFPVLQNGRWRSFLVWTNNGRHHHVPESSLGNLHMLDIAKFVLFISACAGLFGLTLFLFRDQITSSRVAGRFASRNPRSDIVEGELTNVVVMPIARPDAIKQRG